MTTELVLLTLTAIAGLAVAGLWASRPRQHADIAYANTLPADDMFAYTMQDDPC